MSNSILLIPDERDWVFEAERVVELLVRLWPSAKQSPFLGGEPFSYQVNVWDERGLLIDVGPGLISVKPSQDGDAARVALAALRTAPPGALFHFMDDGNNAHLLVSSETSLEELLRLGSAPPL